MTAQDFGPRFHTKQLSSVDAEIAKMAYICDIRLLEPGVIEKVVAGDESVCGKSNPEAFRKLRGLVGMHYMLTNDSLQSLGPEQTARNLADIRARFQERFDLGGNKR
jgi:hypothetical protein